MVGTGIVCFSYVCKDVTTGYVLMLFLHSPLDHPTCHRVANTASLRGFLWCCMDCSPLLSSEVIKIPQLDSSGHCLRSGRSTLGSDMVGNIRVWSIPSLGGKLYRRSVGLSQSVALAWCPRCITGPRVWNDPPADFDPYAYMLHSHSVPSSWLPRNNICQSICAKQHRAWANLA